MNMFKISQGSAEPSQFVKSEARENRQAFVIGSAGVPPPDSVDTSAALFEPARRSALVFSHPNHELAVFGLIQRVQPALIFLTDGGGPGRIEETKRALAQLGLAHRAHFFDYAEAAFYAALLDGDRRFFGAVADRIGESLAALDPEHVLCDAIELYNPVHDLTLPLVRAALGSRQTRVYEIPLIYQKPQAGEAYEVQRLPPALRDRRIALRLTPAEVDVKILARDSIYGELRRQLGAVLDTLPREQLAEEEIVPATETLPALPDGDRVLRYEWRGRLLHTRGLFGRCITWAEHYRPMAGALVASVT